MPQTLKAVDEARLTSMIRCAAIRSYQQLPPWRREWIDFEDWFQEGVLIAVHLSREYDGRCAWSTYLTRGLRFAYLKLQEYHHEELRKPLLSSWGIRAGSHHCNSTHVSGRLVEQEHAVFDKNDVPCFAAHSIAPSSDSYLIRGEVLEAVSKAPSPLDSLLRTVLGLQRGVRWQKKGARWRLALEQLPGWCKESNVDFSDVLTAFRCS